MNKNIKGIHIIVMLLYIISITACKPTSFKNFGPASSYQIISDDGNFSYFKYLIDKAGVSSILQSGDSYTVFAPTNTAFINAGYPLTVLQNMTVEDAVTLAKYHIVAGSTDVTTVSVSQELTTLNGKKITVQNIASHLYVDGGDITNPSLKTTNGLVTDINKLLTSGKTLLDIINNYNSSSTNAQLTFLAAAITRASTGSVNLTALLSGTTPYTFFAPNNAAFIDAGYTTLALVQGANPDVLGNLLKYHLISGTKLTTAFDSTAVTSYNGTPLYFDENYYLPTTYHYVNGISCGNSIPSNLLAANGVIHIISRILPTPIATTTLSRISSDPTLTTFYALIQRASKSGTDFASMLSSTNSSYTVYAVNNTGMAAAGYADAAAVNTTDPVLLAGILRLHLLQRRVNNINVADNGTVPTLYTVINSGTNVASPVYLTLNINGGYKVKGPANTASLPVLTGNVITTNGLLNIIGGMLLQ